MKIDITTLLAGEAGASPAAELLSGEMFNLALEEKLAEMGLVMPAFGAEVLAPQPPALPETEGEAPVKAGAELPAEHAAVEEALTALHSEGKTSPQWQLQQLVTRKSAETSPAGVLKTSPRARAEAPLAANVSPAGEARGKTAALEKPLTLANASEKTPVSAQAGVQPQAVTQEISPAENTPALTATTVALPAAVRATALPAAPGVVTVTHPPQTPEWQQSVSQHIVTFSRNGIQNAEIRLHPEELGSLHITLRLHQEQAQIHIVSEHAQVRHAMEQALPQLRSAMAESGVQLGQANVSADNPFGGAGTQDREGSAGQQNAQAAEEVVEDEKSVPLLLTTQPGNVYGINTFA